MTPLRQKLIRQMDLKNLSLHTRRSYLNAVNGLARHYRKSPETITSEMIEDYLLYLKNEKNNAPASCSLVLTGIRFFYKHVLDQQIEIGFRLSKKPRKLPTVLTVNDRLMRPPVFGVMKPLKSAPKATSERVPNYAFSPPFWGSVFSVL